MWIELNNNTRLPSNRGFTPHGLPKKRDNNGLPPMPMISFGPGLQKSIQEGRINAQEFREMVNSMSLPSVTRNSMLEEIDKALMGKGKN